MNPVSVIALVAYYAITLFMFAMWARFILDLVVVFARGWRPSGIGLVLSELVFTITDPPIKAVRKVVPMIRIGNGALDLSWMLVMLVCIILTSILRGF
ncbi:YggT family protein [Salinibacterium sp. NSLL150]|uniref:YggT family protein n=1 Tax=unclassified Salinibacterium TaxID=2632331 RepID=UPI0018CD67C6|nr:MULTISPECIES: YggT family protein [unclassified Salinibacterium]MBH0024279.1 YggT family protein [Salinibacterium sp. SWN248]MBH0099247.1 YggT family protein [Salinibacterium sp. NSLL35]MBH0102001.1 YggT family protein [Salinibacterium sp. NSLL150]MBH0104761.1 YggT family protein [Salinibacterium sp. NSLL16]MBH0107521.1 YggT family protein [Salinibacterium sp. NSLL17]